MASEGGALSRAIKILVVVAILAAAAIGAWQHRPAVAAWLITGVLSAGGVDDAVLTVERVDLDGISLVEGRIGDTGPAFREIRAQYAPGDLMRGRVGDVEIAGLHVPATLGDNGLEIHGLEDLLGGDAGSDEPFDPPFETVRINDAKLDLATAFGAVVIDFDGIVRAEKSGGLTGSLNLAQKSLVADSNSTVHFELSPNGVTKGEIQLRDAVLKLADRGLTAGLAGSAAFEGGADGVRRLTSDLVLRQAVAGGVEVPDAVFEIAFQTGELSARGIVFGPSGQPEIELHAAAPDLQDSPDLNIQLQVDAVPESLIWRYLDLAPPTDGAASIDLDVVASLPFKKSEATALSVGQLMDTVTASGSLDLSADGLTFPDSMADLRGGGQVEISFGSGTLELDAQSPLEFSAVLVEPDVPDPAASDAPPLRLSVANQNDTQPLLLAAFDPDTLHGSLSAKINFTPFGESENRCRCRGVDRSWV